MGDITFFDKHATLIYEILTKHGFFIQTFKKWYHFTERFWCNVFSITNRSDYTDLVFTRIIFTPFFYTKNLLFNKFQEKKCKSTLLKTAIFYTTFFYVKIFFGSPWRKKRGPCVGSLTHLIFSMEIEWKEKTDNKSLVQGRVPGLYNVHIRLFAWPAWCPEPIFFVREMFLDK